jgi:hypothetical protein
MCVLSERSELWEVHHTSAFATQVAQILSMKEDDIVTAWEKANISAGRRLAERDFRLSYILWLSLIHISEPTRLM